MYICNQCGKLVEEIGKRVGGTWDEELEEECSCGGEFVEAKECPFCGCWIEKEKEVCNECFEKEITPENCFNFGINAEEEIKVNGFLATIFTQKQINNILTNAMYGINRNELQKKAEEFYKNDETWFEEQVIEELKK